jgi:hypothetical protein
MPKNKNTAREKLKSFLLRNAIDKIRSNSKSISSYNNPKSNIKKPK